MTYFHLDRALDSLAGRQYGAFAHDQATRLGFTRDMLLDRRSCGAHIELAAMVYALASFPPTWQRQYKAAELTVPGAALSGLAAAKVHHFDGFRVVRPEIVVAYTKSVRNPLATVHRSASAATTTVDRFRVTTVAQTLFDVMPRVTVDRLERAMDGAILENKVTAADLQERQTAYALSRRRGIGLWRALVDERSADAWAPPESELEARLWPLVLAAPNLPGAVRQPALPWRPREKGRLDVLVPDWRTIIEGDSRRWHARVRDFDADRWRDNEAQAHGYRVLRFTWVHIEQRPLEIIDLIGDVGRWAAAAA